MFKPWLLLFGWIYTTGLDVQYNLLPISKFFWTVCLHFLIKVTHIWYLYLHLPKLWNYTWNDPHAWTRFGYQPGKRQQKVITICNGWRQRFKINIYSFPKRFFSKCNITCVTMELSFFWLFQGHLSSGTQAKSSVSYIKPADCDVPERLYKLYAIKQHKRVQKQRSSDLHFIFNDVSLAKPGNIWSACLEYRYKGRYLAHILFFHVWRKPDSGFFPYSHVHVTILIWATWEEEKEESELGPLNHVNPA